MLLMEFRIPRILALLSLAGIAGCQKTRELAPAPTPAALTRAARYEGQPHVSPDGRTIVLSAFGERDLDLFTMPATGGEPALLYAGPGDDEQPRWSPDGSQIVFRGAGDASTDLFLIAAAGGDSKRLTVESSRDGSPDWSPDGSQIVFASDRGGRSELWILAILTGSAAPLTSQTPPGPNYSAGSPVWSGDRILFSAEVGGSIDIYSISASGGAWTKVTSRAGGEFHPAASKDGRIAFVDDETGFRNLFVLETDGRITSVVEDRTDISEIAWTPDGKSLVYTRRSGAPLLSIPVTGGAADTILDARGANNHPTFSPDGTEIAYDAVMEGQFDIWRVAVSEPGSGPVTSNLGDDREPDWSPAVNRIAFASVHDGNEDVWIMDPSGVEYTNVTQNPARDHSPRWSPDGLSLLFVSDREGQEDIWLTPATGGEARRLTDDPSADLHPTWWRDASGVDWLVYESLRDGTHALWKMPVTGGSPERLTTPAGPGDWDGSPNVGPGTEGVIAFVRSHGGDQGIYRLNPGSGEPVRLADDDASLEDNPAFSPDGQRVVYQGGGNFDLWTIEVPVPASPGASKGSAG